jgi:hypothetical protein
VISVEYSKKMKRSTAVGVFYRRRLGITEINGGENGFPSAVVKKITYFLPGKGLPACLPCRINNKKIGTNVIIIHLAAISANFQSNNKHLYFVRQCP